MKTRRIGFLTKLGFLRSQSPKKGCRPDRGGERGRAPGNGAASNSPGISGSTIFGRLHLSGFFAMSVTEASVLLIDAAAVAAGLHPIVAPTSHGKKSWTRTIHSH